VSPPLRPPPKREWAPGQTQGFLMLRLADECGSTVSLRAPDLDAAGIKIMRSLLDLAEKQLVAKVPEAKPTKAKRGRP
jgi:hypothetical protein